MKLSILFICLIPGLSALQAQTPSTEVTNALDSGIGSLRWALANAAASPGLDTITFLASAFPAGATVNLSTDLTIPVPGDTDGVTLDTAVAGGDVDVAVNAGTLCFSGHSTWTGGGRILLGATSGTAAATLEINSRVSFSLTAPIVVRGGSSGTRIVRGPSLVAIPSPVASRFAGDIVLEAPLTVECLPAGAAIFTGDVDLGPHLLTVRAFHDVYFGGRVFRSGTTGTARMDKTGDRTVWILGDEDNTRLAVSLDEGTLFLDKESDANVHALGGGLGSEDGPALTIRGTGEVIINHSIAASRSTDAGDGSVNDQIADTAGVMLESGLLAVLADEAIGALNGGGVVTDSGIGYTLTVGGGNGSGHFSGAFKEGLRVTKAGTGTQTFSGDADGAVIGSGMSGPVTVDAGTLNLTGSLRNSYGVLVRSGATLAGTGMVRRVTLESGAVFAPGNAELPASPGTFHVGYEGNGSVDWQKHAILRCRIDAPAPADGRLHIDGALSSSDSGIPAPRKFDFQGTGEAGQTWVLATFNNTDFSVADFTYTGLPSGLTGSFTLESDRLTFSIRPFSAIVTVAADENDPFGVAGAGQSLREALRDVPNGESITFAPDLNGQTITLNPANGEIQLARNATVDATALPDGITIDGGTGDNRIFRIAPGITATMQGLTLTGGGRLDDDIGGAISNQGTLTLKRCTFTGNESGAIHNGHLATITLTECTLTDNHAVVAGAIHNAGTATLTHCTVSGNHSGANGSIDNSGGHLTLAYSIVAGTTGGTADIHNDGTLTLVGANLVESILNTGSATVDGSGTMSNAPPLLAPAGNYGGPTQTMALLPGSPARNAAAGSTASHDQRGFPIIGTPDIGAYEAGTFTDYNAWAWESLPATASASGHSEAFDFDNDGRLNGDEFSYLTDPASGASFFAPTVTPGDANVRISFLSAPGRTYTLQQSDSLAGASWSSVPGQSPTTGDGTDKHFTVPSDETRRFFRILAGL